MKKVFRVISKVVNGVVNTIVATVAIITVVGLSSLFVERVIETKVAPTAVRVRG